nr:M16 family metallopeptidase [Parabacteroides chinchillae]
MKHLLQIMALTCYTNILSAQIPESLKVYEHTLSNGLTVWLNEDHTQPKVFGAVVVKAGSKDCPNTGIAHYFEHMMFKGTDKIGTTDYDAEKVVLDSIAAKYDELAATQDSKLRSSIQKEINEMSVRAAEYVIPNEFDRLISRYGGTKLNAGTSYDFTVYFNTFSPQYITQWAEINSERLLNPVFRLFQSELETVYEEKNMYSDMIGSQAIEKLTERYFYPHPYAYPIIGSTESLKNPRLSEMQKFFETYYVGSNMGLILSGDFDAKTVLPILESAFSRIRKGEAPQREIVEIPPFKGKEKMKIKVPIPFVKAMALGFRGVPANHKDKVALNIAMALLNNSNGTGYLDKLTVEHKVMASMAVNESMNEAGILGILVVPKLFVQSYSAAEKLVWKEINRIKTGDFSEETFQSLKLEQKREYDSGLEDISVRAQAMMRIFSQGKSWNDYLDEVARIDDLSKEDVMDVARKYFNENYLYVTKKTGKYPKDNLPKPDYTPVVPRNKDATSNYVKQLQEMPEKELEPRLLDFEKDIKIRPVTSLATLYASPNPVNDIFSLHLVFGIGALERPILNQTAGYLHFIGTDSLSFNDFRNRLQTLGSTLAFEVSDTDFDVKVSGFEANLQETLTLVGDFMRHAKADNKKLGQIVDDAKVSNKAFAKSSESLAKALLEKVMYGEQSRFWTKLPLSRIKKLKGQELVDAFNEARKVECSIHYCGSHSMDEVISLLKENLPVQEINVPSAYPYYRETLSYDEPVVYFFDMPDVSQSIVYGYIPGDALKDEETRHAAKLFTGYFGGDMSSLMFQEIREFRSFAYRVNARINQPSAKLPDKPATFVTMLSTQGDKTLDAMTVLDSLIKKMPERPEARVDAVKQSILNSVNNEYPSFRQISPKIYTALRNGYNTDPNRELLADIENMHMKDISGFYEKHVAGRPVVYAIVGSSKHIDMKKLASFGTIVKVKRKDIYK